MDSQDDPQDTLQDASPEETRSERRHGAQHGWDRPAVAALPPLLLRADATPEIGVGHAMRCLALAQEVMARGHHVILCGSLDVDWVRTMYAENGIEVLPAATTPSSLTALADDVRPAVILLDGYHLDPANGRALRAAGHRVAAMVDGEFGAAQEADVYIDQNPGSAPKQVTPPAIALAGADYTLFRDDVVAAREARAAREIPQTRVADAGTAASTQASTHASAYGPVRVLAVFGGTDPLRAAPVVASLILEAAEQLGLAVDLDVVTRDAALAERLSRRLRAGSSVRALNAVGDLANRAAEADLVVTASGSTVWELLCIGVPTAVVCVIDNQRPGYDVVTGLDLVAGLGHLADLRESPATEDETAKGEAIAALAAALHDGDLRARRSAAGRELLDGRGRERVASVLFGE